MSSNLEVVGQIYEAFGRGDVATIMGLLTDDVDFGSVADHPVAPWHGRRDKAQVPAFFEAIGTHLDVTEFTPLSFATNDTDVQVVIRFGVRVKSTNKAGTMLLNHWWRLRDGRVFYYRGSEDTALTAELLSA